MRAFEREQDTLQLVPASFIPDIRQDFIDNHEQRVEYLREYIRKADPTGDLRMHCDSVGEVAAMIAQFAGHGASIIKMARQAGQLHDLGKTRPDILAVTQLPRKLTPDEFARIKQHTTYGEQLAASVQIEPGILLGIKDHHEQWNGQGYHGLKGDQISLLGQVLSYADIFVAMREERAYKKAVPLLLVVEHVKGRIGTELSPVYKEAFFTFTDWYAYQHLQKLQ